MDVQSVLQHHLSSRVLADLHSWMLLLWFLYSNTGKKKVCDHHLLYCLMEQSRFSGGTQSAPGGVATVWKVCDGTITQSIMLN